MSDLQSDLVLSGSGGGPTDPAAEGGAKGVGEAPPASPGRDAWKRFRRNRLAMVGLVLIILLVLCALGANLIQRGLTHQDPTIGSINDFEAPSTAHYFGTDNTGRDIFTRVMFGARISLRVGFLSALVATVIGVIAGAIAGFYGKWVDTLLMRTTDMFLALPYIILAVVLVVVLGRSEATVIGVIGFLGWMGTARIFRSSVLQVKEREFIEAARAMGCKDRRIIWHHVVPNAIQPVIAYSATFIGTAVLAEAALSFLNVGAEDPTPAWGLMVYQAKGFLPQHPHQLFFPGLFILIMVAAFLFVGDGLRDALDPRLNK